MKQTRWLTEFSCLSEYTRLYPIFLYFVQVFNATEEVNDAVNYPYLRLFTVALKTSATLKYDLLEIEEKWSLPNKGKLTIKTPAKMHLKMLSA